MSSTASPTTKNPCEDTYPGPVAESEKETRAVTDFIQSHLKSIKAYITIHSYSQMLLFPYGYTSKLPPNNEELVCREKPVVYALTPPLTFSQFFINNLCYVKRIPHFTAKEKNLMKFTLQLKIISLD